MDSGPWPSASPGMTKRKAGRASRRYTRQTPGRPEPADPGNAADLRISARPIVCRRREGHPSQRLGPLSTIERIAFSASSPCDGSTTVPIILLCRFGESGAAARSGGTPRPLHAGRARQPDRVAASRALFAQQRQHDVQDVVHEGMKNSEFLSAAEVRFPFEFENMNCENEPVPFGQFFRR